jgi:hypothetical protein
MTRATTIFTANATVLRTADKVAAFDAVDAACDDAPRRRSTDPLMSEMYPRCPECGNSDGWSWQQEVLGGVLTGSSDDKGGYDIETDDIETGETIYTCMGIKGDRFGNVDMCGFECSQEEYEDLSA